MIHTPTSNKVLVKNIVDVPEARNIFSETKTINDRLKLANNKCIEIHTPPPNTVIVEHIAEVPEPHDVPSVAQTADWHAVVVANLRHAAPFSTHL